MMSVPSMKIEPRSGRSSPMRDFRNTDLPVPEGPSNTLTSPEGISRVTSSQILEEPNDFVSPLTSMLTPIGDPSVDARIRHQALCGLSHCSARLGRGIRVAKITILATKPYAVGAQLP